MRLLQSDRRGIGLDLKVAAEVEEEYLSPHSSLGEGRRKKVVQIDLDGVSHFSGIAFNSKLTVHLHSMPTIITAFGLGP